MNRPNDTPVRILHVLGQLRRGGVETWLMHVLRNIDRDRFRMEFLVHDEQPGAYDEEVRRLGGRIHHCPEPRRFVRYARHFRTLLMQHGPYDVVHSHVYFHSGIVLRLARQAGIPRRIAHSHTAQPNDRAGLYRRLYRTVMRNLILSHATAGLACSSSAADSLFGPRWQSDQRWRVLPYGIELAPYAIEYDRQQVRQELGISPEALVIGHVGTFSAVKNHEFLVDVAAEIAQRRPDAWFLFVGDGPLRPGIEQQLVERQLSDRCVLPGSRDDVPRLMCAAMDAFLFPSFYEGLGLVLVEAQAAGLPAVASGVVPPEAVVVKESVCSLPLTESAATWAETLLSLFESPKRPSRASARRRIEQSDFAIENSVAQLEKMYTN